jgi:DNA polymerase-3 subunit alpha
MDKYETIKKEIFASLKIKNEDIIQKVSNEISILGATEGLKEENNLVSFYNQWKKHYNDIGSENKINSWTAYAIGMTMQKPTGEFLPSRRVFARVGFPDIDLDFDDSRRDEIYEYFIQKYGRDYVANIGTLGALNLRSCLTRVIKALDIANAYHKGPDAYKTENVEKVNEILNRLPGKKGVAVIKIHDEKGEQKAIKSVDDAYKYFEDFRFYLDKHPDILKHARNIEGVLSIFGAHPAGICLSDIPLNTLAPVRLTRTKKWATQFALDDMEKIGFIKFDLLALKSLAIIDKTVKVIKSSYGIDIDIENLPLDDAHTLELYRSGKLNGIFQCETTAMQHVMMDIGVDRFDDIVAAIALFRPGPMASIPEYCARKSGRSKIDYFHPTIEPFVKPYLENTMGVATYQEQIMQICNSLAGFSIVEGYDMIKGIGKKLPHIINKYAKRFIAGCVQNSVPEKIAQEYWTKFIVPFAGYGFNKCHSAAYAYQSYITAYLKANYTDEFMCEFLNVENERKNQDTIELIEKDLPHFDIEILPKNFNTCSLNYTIVRKKNTSQGIMKTQIAPSCMVKGIGLVSAQEIAKHSPYSDLADFASRTDTSLVDKEVIGCLVDAGFLNDYMKKQYKVKKKKVIKEDIVAEFVTVRNDLKSLGKKGLPSTDLFE